MKTRTKLLTTAAVGLLAVGGFAAGAAADDTGADDLRRARNQMHAQMGGDAGMEMMSGIDMATMQAMHDAIDPEAMEAMHDEMVALLPEELRAEADAMHQSMTGSMGDVHESHHRSGS